MVGKLFKYEFASYLRTWLPVQIIMLGIAALGRFVQFFEADTTVYKIIFGSSVVVYALSIIVSFVLTGILCIVRFYKNLFTGEGYLSFTLPVTPAQHILIKLLATVAVEIGTFIVALTSVCIITSGELFNEILKAIAYLTNMATDILGTHLVLYVIEFIFMLIMASVCGTLLIYGCISIGQTFNKSRVGWAVGVYFIYYMICQIAGTVFATVITLFYDKLPLNNILEWIEANPNAAIHIFLCSFIVIYLITAVIYYAVSYFIIKRKLNLE